MTLEDVIQELNIALVVACRAYDPSKSKLNTFAHTCLKNKCSALAQHLFAESRGAKEQFVDSDLAESLFNSADVDYGS